MLTSKRMEGLHPYVPGEQPKDRQYIKLNANENPYPPSPCVIEAVCDFAGKHPEKLGLYPDPDSNELHAAIAKMLNKTGGVLCKASLGGENGRSADGEAATDGTAKEVRPAEKIPFEITPDMIYTGNGSDEVLSFVFYAFFDSAKKFVMPQFTYSFYPVYAGFYNIDYDAVPLKDDWTLDVEKMLELANKNHAGTIFANPNAPTGLGLSREEVRQMLLAAPRDQIFIVDEAYVDFGGETCIPLLKEFDNLVIVRTFSKSLCGAGQRLGYIVSNPELIKIVTTVKNSVNHFPIDALAQVSGTAACNDIGYYVGTSKKVAATRDDFYKFLCDKGFYAIKSQTNFIFARPPKNSGADLYKKIKADGILIRHFATPGIEDFVRITIGTDQQMAALKEAIGKIL